jgi:hypothetical protein
MKSMGSGGIPPPSLISALEGGEWSDSRPGRFTSGGIVPGTRWIGGWVCPKAGLDAVNKRKSLFPAENHKSSAVQPVARRYTK